MRISVIVFVCGFRAHASCPGRTNIARTRFETIKQTCTDVRDEGLYFDHFFFRQKIDWTPVNRYENIKPRYPRSCYWTHSRSKQTLCTYSVPRIIIWLFGRSKYITAPAVFITLKHNIILCLLSLRYIKFSSSYSYVIDILKYFGILYSFETNISVKKISFHLLSVLLYYVYDDNIRIKIKSIIY